MKFKRLIAAFVFVTALAILPALAQTKPPHATGADVHANQCVSTRHQDRLDLFGSISRFKGGHLAVQRLDGYLDQGIPAKDDGTSTSSEQKIAQLTDEINKLQQGAGVVPQDQIARKGRSRSSK